MPMRSFPGLALLVWAIAPAAAQTPGMITGGSNDVMVNGKPAARAADTTSDGAVVEGSNNVFINGKPAAVIGGQTHCGGGGIGGGVIVGGGGGNVLINGKPMARAGDATAGCPK
ncbi:PAAR [Rhodopseudomonas palustris BisB5]|uniref:PAAR n=1 Tax=Rhodopseudomonas palustris (strain BisB5) TaxID=316057 RepID=Q136D8_RHOPS|nr:PAAR [Rhodopseudomonas palustris BisB5]